MLGLLGLYALLFLAGILFLCLLDGGRAALAPENLALGPVMGAAITGAFLVLGLVIFDRFAEAAAYALPGFFLAAALLRRLAVSGQAEPAACPPPPSPLPVRARVALLFPVIAFLYTGLLLAVTYKDGALGDYLSIWGFKALVLAENDAIRIPSFLDWTYYHHHQDYPVLFPALQALLYRMAGEELDRSAKLLYPLLLLSASLFVYFRLLRRHGLTAAVAGGALGLMTPAIAGYHPGICSAYMDIPLGLFLLPACLYGMEWRSGGRASDALKAGVFLAAAALTKNEGLAAATLATGIFLFFGLRKGWRARAAGLPALALLPAIAVASWMLLRTRLPAGASDYIALFTGDALLEKITVLPEVSGRYLLELCHFERWGFLWVLLAATASRWIRKGGVPAGVFLVAMAVLHILALTVSPLGVTYQLASALSRLPGHLAPLAAALVGLAFAREAERPA